MQDREPTIRARILGEGLRRALTKAGISGKTAAYQLGWDQSKVSRMVTGKRPGSEVDVSALLAVCRVRGEERERLLRLAREQYIPGLLRHHGSHLPKQVVELVEHENLAVTTVDFEPLLVPGLLQTGSYARAVISRCVNVGPGGVDEMVAARLARQELVTRPGAPRFVFYIHENALHLPPVYRTMMRDQLTYLKTLAELPNIAVRVVPTNFGFHAGMAGSFELFEFAEFHPVVYLESETTSLFIEGEAEIEAYNRIVAALDVTALDVGQSRHLLAQLAGDDR